MLTAEERRERYARQDGRETGPRRRRIAHKERHANLTQSGLERRSRIGAIAGRLRAHRARIRQLGD